LRDQLQFYQGRLSIDRNKLDEELSEFPSAFYTVSDFYVDADRRAKRLEQRLDRERASITSVLRSVAEEEGIKRTETQLKQEVQIHPAIRKLMSKHAQAQSQAKRWETLKEAMVQKSFSLKGLVSLAMHEHFQSSHATPDDGMQKRKRKNRS